MTVIDLQRWSRPLTRSRLGLATDLDGTLLAGASKARHRVRGLFALIPARDDAPAGTRPTLVFVTGRGLETVMSLPSGPTIPAPGYNFAGSGATVVGRALRPLEPGQPGLTVHGPGSQAMVDEHDVTRWGQGFLAALERAKARGRALQEAPPDAAHQRPAA